MPRLRAPVASAPAVRTLTALAPGRLRLTAGAGFTGLFTLGLGSVNLRALEAAEEELLAYTRFPREHWPKIRSTDPLERDRPPERRGRDLPHRRGAPAPGLGALLVEINDEWLVAQRYISLESLSQLEANGHGPSGPVGADPPALEGALVGAGKSTT